MNRMTRNLDDITGNATGLGHFLVVMNVTDDAEALTRRLQGLRPGITGGKQPPVVQSLGQHALAATWGGARIDMAGDSAVIGTFQRTRNDMPGVTARLLRKLFFADDPALVNERTLAGSNFAAVVVDRNAPRAMAVTAPFRQLPLYHATLDGVSAFASDARLFTETGIVPRRIDMDALYHYLNYSCIPAPCSIFEHVQKVPAGTVVRTAQGSVTAETYWRPRFEGDRDGRQSLLEEEMREQLFSTVRAYRPVAGTAWGAFLSGGTDSSSITGIFATEPGHDPVHTFSIGFGEEAYDELAFARIAAEHFAAKPHYRQVNEDDTLAAIPKLLESFDEPYGNASVIPTYYCAAMAEADGRKLLIAGDGGDENFGGNKRYARDAVYRAYERVPQPLRRALAKLLDGPSFSKTLLESRIRHFAKRGALANPERFYREDSFASECFEALLSPHARAAIDRDSSLNVMRSHYQACSGATKLHRLMYVDLMMAIADNDLVKVQRACHAAGVGVAYPYLDPELVNFAGRLDARWKVKGLDKRYLFKRALRDLLPEAIIKKPKHGFGLPIAHWTRRAGPFRDLVQDTLRSKRTRERGYFDTGFVNGLLDRHDQGDWDFSPELWRLLMLELWQREYLDAA